MRYGQGCAAAAARPRRRLGALGLDAAPELGDLGGLARDARMQRRHQPLLLLLLPLLPLLPLRVAGAGAGAAHLFERRRERRKRAAPDRRRGCVSSPNGRRRRRAERERGGVQREQREAPAERVHHELRRRARAGHAAARDRHDRLAEGRSEDQLGAPGRRVDVEELEGAVLAADGDVGAAGLVWRAGRGCFV